MINDTDIVERLRYLRAERASKLDALGRGIARAIRVPHERFAAPHAGIFTSLIEIEASIRELESTP